MPATTVQCKWPSGCRLRTSDPSGLCHNHRRFTLAIVDDRNNLVRDDRSVVTHASRTMRHDYAARAAVAAQAMVQRPTVMSVPDEPRLVYLFGYHGQSLRWGGQDVTIPDSVDGVSFARADSGVIAVQFDQDPDEDMLQLVVNGTQWYRDHEYAVRWDLYGSHADEFEDVAQAMSALPNLGAPIGAHVTYRSAGDSDQFIIERPDGSRMVGEIRPDPVERDDRDRLSNVCRLRSLSQSLDSLTDDEANVIISIVWVRNRIAEMGVRHPDTGRLYLPLGWAEFSE